MLGHLVFRISEGIPEEWIRQGLQMPVNPTAPFSLALRWVQPVIQGNFMHPQYERGH